MKVAIMEQPTNEGRTPQVVPQSVPSEKTAVRTVRFATDAEAEEAGAYVMREYGEEIQNRAFGCFHPTIGQQLLNRWKRATGRYPSADRID